MPTATELRELDDDELDTRLVEYRRELLNLRFQLATGQLDNYSRVAETKRNVARVLMVLRDREIALAEGRDAGPVFLEYPNRPRRIGHRRDRRRRRRGRRAGRRCRRRRGRGGPVTTPQPEPAARNGRKVREGLVVSDKMESTVLVAVVERVRHARYGKTVQRTTRLYAHDEANDAKLGDRVRVMETRPLSKLKRWRVTDVLERAR